MSSVTKTNHISSANTPILQPMQPSHVQRLEALQQLVFPTLSPDQWIRAEHYLHHLRIFPEGQFVITAGDNLIGMTTTMRCSWEFATHRHTFQQAIAGGWMTHHDPAGDWLYGLDIGIHPAWRGQGLARKLYQARHHLIHTLNMKGQLTVGMMNGYGAVSGQYSGEEYYRQLLAGQRTDPTLTPQMKIGFEPLALIPGYVDDPACGNFGVLLTLNLHKLL